METKSLLFGLVGFLIGGLVVSVAATQSDKPETSNNSSAVSEMAEHLKQKTGDNFDQAFISEMIVHHEGAIEMAELAKENAKHDEIKKLADDILHNQSKEIDMMQAWQKDWGYESTSTSHRRSGH